jgi:hypothetical protein
MAPKRITRAVTLADVSDLLEHPPRAHIAYVSRRRIDASPVRFHRVRQRYFVVAPEGIASGDRVSLLIDDGVYNSELRGVRINGTLTTPDPMPSGLPPGVFEIIPSSVTAWDYAAMRDRSAHAP